MQETESLFSSSVFSLRVDHGGHYDGMPSAWSSQVVFTALVVPGVLVISVVCQAEVGAAIGIVDSSHLSPSHRSWLPCRLSKRMASAFSYRPDSSGDDDNDWRSIRIVSCVEESERFTDCASPAPTHPTDGSDERATEKHYQHHLVLHFDINETILIGDEAGGDTREDCLNKILAKSAFVQCPTTSSSNNAYEATSAMEPTTWWTGKPLGIMEKEDQRSPPPPLYTGWTWPSGCCPYYRTKFKKRAKSFVEHDGQIYRPLYDKMNQLLRPRDPHEDVEHPILSHMIPAFFETLVALTESQQPFTLVLRTMGSDLSDIAAAVTAFGRGQHPEYPHFRNKRLVLTSDRLVKGRWAAVGDPSDNHYEYQLWRDDQLVAGGDDEVLEFLHSQTVCGIQDDYPFWTRHGQEPWAGKPVWDTLPSTSGQKKSESDDNGSTSFHHILFDDNIHNVEHDSIASVRVLVDRQQGDEHDNKRTFQSLSGQALLEQQGRHLIRVPTIEPILNPRWFLEQIEKSQRLVSSSNFSQSPSERT